MAETELVLRAKAGDETARTQLVQRFTPVAYRYSWRMMRNEQDARDAAQDTMLKVLRNLDRYDTRWRFTTWLISITRNTCIDELRKRRRRSDKEVKDVADHRPSPVQEAIRRQEADQLHAAMDTLPALYREALVMYHFEHLKYREISDILEIPIGTVMNRIFRARRKLGEALDLPLRTGRGPNPEMDSSP